MCFNLILSSRLFRRKFECVSHYNFILGSHSFVEHKSMVRRIFSLGLYTARIKKQRL